MRIEFNLKATATWHALPGDTHVLVIDDYLANASSLRAFALSLSYDVSRDFFPGWRAYASLDGSGAGARKLAGMMLDRLWPAGWPRDACIDEIYDMCAFSVTAWDDAVQTRLASRGQHVDHRGWLSTVVHLAEAPSQDYARGTAFWKHRRTGLTVWVEEEPAYCQMLAKLLKCPFISQLEELVAIEPGAQLHDFGARLFSNGDRDVPATSLFENEDWELLLFVPAKFNRLVCYPGWQVHSLVELGESGTRLVMNTARLTMMQFLDVPVLRPSGWSLRRDGRIAPVEGLRMRA